MKNFRMLRFLQIIGLVSVCVLLTWFVPLIPLRGLRGHTSHGQAQGWSRPLLLSTQGGTSWFPDIAVDTSGQIHVVWSSAIDLTPDVGYDLVLYTTSQDGQTWRELNDIAAYLKIDGSDEVSRPALAIDARGQLHLTSRYMDIHYTRAFIPEAASAGAWSAPFVLTEKSGAYFSRIAIDSRGNLHIIYTENVPNFDCQVCYHVFYMHSDDAGMTWSEPIDISLEPTGAAKPQLLIDEQDNLHAVWEFGQGGGLGQLLDPKGAMYAASYDGGATWVPPQKFLTTAGHNKNITLGMAGNQQLVMVWWSIPDDVVYYQTSSDRGRSWAAPRPLPGVVGYWAVHQGKLDDYALATDSAGDAHLVMVGRLNKEQKTLSLLHLSWDGARWSQPEVIATYAGDVPEWPRIAIGNGNQLHIVWFVRNKADVFKGGGDYKVWYARGASNAPTIPSVALPEPTPTTAPIVIVQTTPTTTPVPTFGNPPSSVTLGELQSETARLLFVAQNLIPSLALLAVVALVVWWRRR